MIRIPLSAHLCWAKCFCHDWHLYFFEWVRRPAWLCFSVVHELKQELHNVAAESFGAHVEDQAPLVVLECVSFLHPAVSQVHHAAETSLCWIAPKLQHASRLDLYHSAPPPKLLHVASAAARGQLANVFVLFRLLHESLPNAWPSHQKQIGSVLAEQSLAR